MRTNGIWEKTTEWLKKGIFLLILFSAGMACAEAPEASLQPGDVFQSPRKVVSLHFKQRLTHLQKENEEILVDYWASRGTIGASFRVNFLFQNPVSQMVILYPDAEPFMMRFMMVPNKSICYKNIFSKKNYGYNPHRIRFKTLWHSMLDNLYQIIPQGKLTLLGEEMLLGYPCKKVGVGDISKRGFIVWYSPQLDLLLKTETFENGKIISRKEALELQELRIPPEIFKLPPNCTVRTLSIQEFDALDVVKLSQDPKSR